MKHQIDGFITYRRCKYTDKDEISFLPYDPTPYSSDKVVIRAHSIEVEVDDSFDPRPQQVAALDEQIQKTRAEFTARITELQEQKAKLLCIEVSA